MADYTLSAKITGDSAGFVQSLARARGELSQMQNSFAGVRAVLEKAGSGLAAAGQSTAQALTAPLAAVRGQLDGLRTALTGGIPAALAAVQTAAAPFWATLTLWGQNLTAWLTAFPVQFTTASSTLFSGITSNFAALGVLAQTAYAAILTGAQTAFAGVSAAVTGAFGAIQGAWSGLVGFAQGVFDGIGAAVQRLVGQVKGFVNGVIGGINGALTIINAIPGVAIAPIPYLLHGADDWAGGFARMNEGGRGELVYLPGGAQVVPHDLSVQYAKEAARAAAQPVQVTVSGNHGGDTFNFYEKTPTPAEHYRAVRRAKREVLA